MILLPVQCCNNFPLKLSSAEPTTAAVRVLAAERPDDQLRRLPSGHLDRDGAGAADAEPAHHPGAADQRLRQLHLLREQHRAGEHIRVRVER